MKTKKLIYLFRGLVVSLSVLLPVGLSIFFTAEYSIKPYLSYELKKLLLITIVLAFLFIAIVKLIKNIKKDKYAKYFYPIAIFLIALLPRLLVNHYVGIRYGQVSDFEIAFLNGINRTYNNAMYARYPHWALYPQLIYVVSLLSNNKTTAAMQIFNSIILSFSCVFIYFISEKVTKNKTVGLLSGLLFALYLPNIFYSNILTPEHPSIFFTTLGFLLYVLGRSKKDLKNKIIIFLVSSLIFAVGNFFRPFSQIMVIAIVMSELVNLIVSKNRLRILIALFFLVLGYESFISLGFKYLELSIGQKVNKSFSTIALYIGLNSKCKGSWCLEVSQEVSNIIQENADNYDKVDKVLKEKLTNDIKQNYTKLPQTVYSKSIYSWSGDDSAIGWTLAGKSVKSEDQYLKKLLVNIFSPLLSIEYSFILMLYVLSACTVLFKKSIGSKDIPTYLFILGSTLLFLIVEAQPRYKSVIIPFIILLSVNQNPLFERIFNHKMKNTV